MRPEPRFPSGADEGAVLIVTAGNRTCAVPLRHVGETMRPLPIEPVAGTPAFVRGLAMVRGAPIPVIELGALLGDGVRGRFSRFITLKTRDRRLAMAVDAVVGTMGLEPTHLGALPTLLRDAEIDAVEAIGRLDADLLVLLRVSRLVPDEVWAALAPKDANP